MDEVLKQLYTERYQAENFVKRQKLEWEDVSRLYTASWDRLLATVDQTINKSDLAIEMQSASSSAVSINKNLAILEDRTMQIQTQGAKQHQKRVYQDVDHFKDRLGMMQLRRFDGKHWISLKVDACFSDAVIDVFDGFKYDSVQNNMRSLDRELNNSQYGIGVFLANFATK